MGYGKSGMGGAHPIMKHMHKAGGGTGTKQAMSKNAEIKYGGPVIDQFKSPMKKMYGDTPLEVGDEPKISSKKNFEISMHRKGVGRIKEGSNREKNLGTRTGPDKVAGSRGTHLVNNPKGGGKRKVVTEQTVSNLQPKKRQKLVNIG
tara:strand:+ start:3366 stop:3806 length:441 start_codon:yes stop_codon:yes gene_type:complete